jgi:hypothetical protein
MLYWAACAVLLPVTTWDSQVYNLGRLLIAEKAGFWSNPHWISERQVIFPWAFDAVHYPFVKLGFGEAVHIRMLWKCFPKLLLWHRRIHQAAQGTLLTGTILACKRQIPPLSENTGRRASRY